MQMMIRPNEYFIESILNGNSLLPFNEWKQKTNLYKIWDQRVDNSDIRYILCNGNPNIFVETIYSFLKNNIHTFLDKVYTNAFSDKGFKDFIKINRKNNSIINVTNNPGYFRNICLDEIIICGGDNDINLSIKNSMIETMQGRVRKCFFMPSVFQDVYNGKVSPNMVLSFNKSCKLVSIFSPDIYKFLVENMCNYSAKSESILFSTASWCVPVIAVKNLNYLNVGIVDVQSTVLEKCHALFNEKVVTSRNILFDQTYELETYCVPSEFMDQTISKKYDHIISCPPYYDLEIYGGSDQQSTLLYNSYNEWLEKYWRRTVIASKNLLNENGVFAFVMGYNVRYHKMSDDMVNIAKEEGFKLVDQINIMPKKKSENLHQSMDQKYEVCSYFN